MAPSLGVCRHVCTLQAGMHRDRGRGPWLANLGRVILSLLCLTLHRRGPQEFSFRFWAVLGIEPRASIFSPTEPFKSIDFEAGSH